MKLKALIVIFALACCIQVNAQLILTYHNIVSVLSSNGVYCAKSTPARSLDITSLGKTEIFDTRTSQLLYTIPHCLTCGQLYISNDGQWLLHLLNRDYYPTDEPSHTHAFTLYFKDSIVKQMTIQDLIGCNNELTDCQLTYNVKYNWRPNLTLRDTLISNQPIFAIGDTVFIYTSTPRLLRIHLPSAQIDSLPFNYHSLEQLQNLPAQQRIETKFRCPSDYIEEDICALFARKMRMVPQGNSWLDKYKFYYVNMLLRIDRDGKTEIISMENRDSLPEAKMRKIVSKMHFDADFSTEGIDFWYKKLYESMRKQNKIVATREGTIERQRQREEYKRRLIADTIDGIYIPRDINDCFNVLDTMLSPKIRNRIINTVSRDGMSEYHFGLGMWMRNNWGFWGGSRLQTYMENRGVYHPDDMSGAILRYYYDHLHSQDSAWRAFDTTLVPPPPPDTATVAIPMYKVTDLKVRRLMRRVVNGRTIDPEDEETKTKKSFTFFMNLSNITPADTNWLDEILELSDSTITKPQVIITFNPIESYVHYCDHPVYGYVKYRGRYFLLTQKEINPLYFKSTRKTKRYWKPKKHNDKPYSFEERIYVLSNGSWHIIWEF